MPVIDRSEIDEHMFDNESEHRVLSQCLKPLNLYWMFTVEELARIPDVVYSYIPEWKPMKAKKGQVKLHKTYTQVIFRLTKVRGTKVAMWTYTLDRSTKGIDAKLVDDGNKKKLEKS